MRSKKETLEIVGQRIRMARIYKGLSQAGLAEKTGTKQSGISRAETGKYSFTVEYLLKIANGLDMDLMLPNFVDKTNERRND